MIGAMPVLDVAEIGRSYGARAVLESVTFTLGRRDRLGLVGANGSGKTTLGRILAGWEEPDRGTIVRRRGIEVGYLPQEPRFEGDPTAIEAVLGGLAAWIDAKSRYDEASRAIESGEDVDGGLGRQQRAAEAIERLGGWSREHDARALLDRFGVSTHEKRVNTMSGGERRRVDLARLLIARPDLAILDEPTNHLDVEAIEWLETELRDEQPGALLLITHDRYFLDAVVTRTAELSRGALRVYDGGYEAYLVARAEREAHEARVERNRQSLLRRELEWLRRSPSARRTKQKARIQRAHKALAADAPKRAREVGLHLEAVRSGRTLFDLEDVAIEIDGRRVVDGLSLYMSAGERIGIVGPNGCGKTTLLRAILGEHPLAAGIRRMAKNTKVTYLGQAREGLDESMSVLDAVAGGRQRVTLGKRDMDTPAYLERFLFDRGHQRQRVSTLSGGEKARVLLAKLLLMPANLLVLDEPANDLDVTTLAALEQLLVEMNASALVVTHDRWFLDRIATSTLVFEGEGAVVRYAGGYTDARAQRTESTRAEASERARRSVPKKPSKASERRGLTYAERLELEGIIETISKAESTVAALEAKLSDPALYATGGESISENARALEDAKTKLTALEARWEELEKRQAE